MYTELDGRAGPWFLGTGRQFGSRDCANGVITERLPKQDDFLLITKCRRIQPAKQCDVVTDRRYRFAACHRRWGTDTREPVASTVSCISFMSVWSVCGNSNTWGQLAVASVGESTNRFGMRL